MLNKKKGLIDEAIQSFEISNKAASDLDNVEYLIKAQFELAGLHLERFNENNELTDYSAVLGYLNNLTYLSEEQFIPRLMCDIQMLKGLLLIHGNKPEKAMESIADAYELAKKFNYPKVQRDAQILLNEIDKEQKIERFAAILEEKGFEQTERMSDTLKKYQGFKFVKAPKVVGSKLYGIALVDADTAVMKYRFTTTHEYQDEASLVPMLVAAINQFSQSVLEEDLVLSEVTQEGRDLLIDMIEDRIIIAITEKITFNIKNQFEKYVNTLRKFIPKIEPLLLTDIQHEVLDRITIVYFLLEGILQERSKEQKSALDASLKELEDVIAQVESDLRDLLERAERASPEEIITQVDSELKRIDSMIRAKDPKLLAYIETYGIPVAKSYDDALELHETETVDLIADEIQLDAKEVAVDGFEHEFTLRQEDLAELGVQLEDLDHSTDLDLELHEIESDLEDIEEGRVDTSKEVVLDADEVVLKTEDISADVEAFGIPSPPDKPEEELKDIILTEDEEIEDIEEIIKEEFENDSEMITLRPPPEDDIVEIKPAETLDVNEMETAPQMDEILLDSDEVVLETEELSFDIEAEELAKKAEELIKKTEKIEDEEDEEWFE